MSKKKWFRRTAAIIVACASVVSVSAAVGSTGAGVVSAAEGDDPGGEFHPLDPVRILDTRPQYSTNDVAPIGAKPTGIGNATTAEFLFDPLGKGGIPTDPSKILALVMTVTVTQPSHEGYLSVYPDGFVFGGDDISALLTFGAGADVPNLAVVGVGDNGKIRFNANTSQAGSYHLVVDVFGWISTSTHDATGSRLILGTPGRVLDTRSGQGPNPRGDGVPFGPADSLALQIRGADAVKPNQVDIVPDNPAVTAVLINLALINNGPGSQHTFLTATPTDVSASPDKTANSLAVPGGIHANMAVVPIGPDGKIDLYNNAGTMNLVVDVLGYFVESPSDSSIKKGRIVPLQAAFRVFDTRLPEFGDAPLGHGSKEQWSFKNFAESVTLNPPAPGDPCVLPCQVGPPQQGLIGGLFAIDLQKLYPTDVGVSSYLQMYPAGPQPVTANINMFPGEIVPNMSAVKYGTSDDLTDKYVVEAFNAYGSVDYILDVYAIVLDDA